MNKTLSGKIAEHTSYGMILITVAFFITQVYSRIYTTHDGNLMIAFIILGSFLCGKEYGIITGVILSIFVLIMRYIHHQEGFSEMSRCDYAARYYQGARSRISELQEQILEIKALDMSSPIARHRLTEFIKFERTAQVQNERGQYRYNWAASAAQCSGSQRSSNWRTILNATPRTLLDGIKRSQVKTVDDYQDGSLTKEMDPAPGHPIYRQSDLYLQYFNKKYPFVQQPPTQKSSGTSQISNTRKLHAESFWTGWMNTIYCATVQDGINYKGRKLRFNNISGTPEEKKDQLLALLIYELRGFYSMRAFMNAYYTRLAKPGGRCFGKFDQSGSADSKQRKNYTLALATKNLPWGHGLARPVSGQYTISYKDNNGTQRSVQFNGTNSKAEREKFKALLNTDPNVKGLNDFENKMVNSIKTEGDRKQLMSDGQRYQKYKYVFADNKAADSDAAYKASTDLTGGRARYDKTMKEYNEARAIEAILINKMGMEAFNLDFPFSTSPEAANARRQSVLGGGNTSVYTALRQLNMVKGYLKIEQEFAKTSEGKKLVKEFDKVIKDNRDKVKAEAKKIQEEIKQQQKDLEALVAKENAKIQADKDAWEQEKIKLKNQFEKAQQDMLNESKASIDADKKAWEGERQTLLDAIDAKGKAAFDEITKQAEEAAAAALAKAKLEAEKLLRETDAEAARRLANAGEKAGKIESDAEKRLAAAREQAGDITDEANAQARAVKREAEAQSLNAKARDDATRARLEKYEIELNAERDRAQTAEDLAEAQRLRLEKELRNAKNAQAQTTQAGINIREELAREREARAAAEDTIFAERARAQALKEAEVARCARDRAKKDAQQRRADRVRKQREQARLEAERRKREAEEAEKKRLMETKAIRMRELAQERARKLRATKLSLNNQAQLEREEDYMKQISTTSGLLAGLGTSDNRGFNPATAAAQLGPDGLPIQFGLDDLYRGKSQNEYLNVGPNDSLYVNRTTLGGYVGPLNYELYSSAPSQPAPTSFVYGMAQNSGPGEIIKKPF